jgi:hypothetical protein
MPSTADPILASLASTFTGLGYTVKTATEPKVMEWDAALPLTRICPVTRPTIEWHAFQHRNVLQRYQVVYVQANNLDPTVDVNANQFKLDLINNFQGPNTALAAVAGVWNSIVSDDVDYDRSLLPQGYNYTTAIVEVSWIES